MTTTPLSVQLLQQVLKAAEAKGVDQAYLAQEARLKPETISRAKKRVGMELNTIERLAAVVGLQIALQPIKAMTNPAKRQSSISTAPLSKPRFGLAWANPGAQEGTLLRTALLQSRFDAILEASVHDGVPFVRQQMQQLRETGDLDDALAAKLDRMVRSIERGFADADGNVHAPA